MKHEIIMPDLGQTTSEGKVAKWLKKPGDRVSKGEPLLEVETDKVTMDVEAYVGGFLREILVAEGELASALTPIAILTDEAEEPYERSPREPTITAVTRDSPRGGIASSRPAEGTVSAAPAAKSLARELGIDLGLISGTGPGGLITRKDVERFAADRAAVPAGSGAAMAALTTKSKQTIPHFYVTVDVDVSSAEGWRESWNASHPELPATVNDVFVQAAARALRDVPGVNVSFHDGQPQAKSTADILLVVAVESGLMLVPIADPTALPWEEYLRHMRKLLEKAKRGRITEVASQRPPLLAVSNLGMVRVKQFAAIIPPSCTAILAVGALREEPVVRQGQIEIGRVCSLTLSADHRVVDGLTAAQFLASVQDHLNSL